jgi:hypothetical protein
VLTGHVDLTAFRRWRVYHRELDPPDLRIFSRGRAQDG